MGGGAVLRARLFSLRYCDLRKWQVRHCPILPPRPLSALVSPTPPPRTPPHPDKEAAKLYKLARKAVAEYVEAHRPWGDFFGGFSAPAPASWAAAEERLMFNYHRFAGNYATLALALAAWTLLRSPRLLLALVALALVALYTRRPSGGSLGGASGSLGGRGGGGGAGEAAAAAARRYGLLAAALLAAYFSGVVGALAAAAAWAVLVVGLHALARTSPRPHRDVRAPSSSSAAGARRSGGGGGGGGRGGESGAESDSGAGGYGGGGGGGGGWQPMGPGQWGSGGGGGSGGSEDGQGLRARGMGGSALQHQQPAAYGQQPFAQQQQQQQQQLPQQHYQQQQQQQQQYLQQQQQHFPQQAVHSSVLPRPKQREH